MWSTMHTILVEKVDHTIAPKFHHALPKHLVAVVVVVQITPFWHDVVSHPRRKLRWCRWWGRWWVLVHWQFVVRQGDRGLLHVLRVRRGRHRS